MTLDPGELYGPTYTLSEAAEVCRIPQRTLWRWRADNLLTTTEDWEHDFQGFAEMLAGRGVIRMATPARCVAEDVTRLMVLSHLGWVYGCDRLKLLPALGHPYAVDIQPGEEPEWLAVYPDRDGKLTRCATRNLAEVEDIITSVPGYVVPLSGFRGAAVIALRNLVEKQSETRRRRKSA